MTPVTPPPSTCLKCLQPRMPGQKLCRQHRNEYARQHRAERKIKMVAAADARDTGDTNDTRHDTDPGSVTPPETPPGTGGNGRNGPNGHGNGWGGWNPRSKVATRVFLAALGGNNGEATKALIDKLASIPLTEKNPWVLMAFWRMFRDAVEGTPPKATPPPDARPRSRIVVQVGPEPAPPAEPEAAAPPVGEHDENGERFVAVPPPD